MSGYATRLAARGMGRAAGALLAPRSVPGALPGAPTTTLDAGVAPAGPVPRVQAPEPAPVRDATSTPAATPRTPPAAPRDATPAAEPSAAAPLRPAEARADPAAPVRERLVERERTTELRVEVERVEAAQPSTAADRREAQLAAPSAPAPPAAEVRAATPSTGRTHELRVATERIRPADAPPHAPQADTAAPPTAEPRSHPTPARTNPTPVELRPRPVAPPPVPAAPAARAAARAEAQTVEVRIGRVEVRAPRPPDLPGWNTSSNAPAAPAPAEPPFARMAAARRYLDRSWG